MTRFLTSSGLAAMAFALSHNPALAQTNAEPTAPATEMDSDGTFTQANEIVVTAQKRSESINDVGMSISAVSGETLADRGIIGVEDLAKIVSGFTYTKSSFGAPVYTIRGIGFYDTTLGASPSVSIYLDEVPLPYSVLSSGVALDLERVEVLKGPQGTLFGQNSTGGAVNYIAAKPEDAFGAGFSASYGRFDASDFDAYVTGPLSKTLNARVAVRYDHRDDWQKSYSRSDEGGKSDFVTARMLLDWEASDRLRLNLNLNGWIDRSDNQFGQLIGVGGNLARLSPSVRDYPLAPQTPRAADWNANTDFSRRQDYAQAAVRADYDLSDTMRLTSLSSYQSFDRQSLVDADATAITNFHISQPAKIDSYYQEIRIAAEPRSGVSLILGGNASYDDIEETATSTNPVSSFPFLSSDAIGNQTAETLAAFGSADWQISKTLTLQLGARYTTQIRKYAGCLRDTGDGTVAALGERLALQVGGVMIDVAPGECATLDGNFQAGLVNKRLKEDNISWRAGINFEPTVDTLLYGNIGRGYKNGTFPVLGATFAAQFDPATQESVLAYEAGFKQTFRSAELQINGAAFYYDYSDKQVRGSRIDPVLGRLNQLLNIPQSRIYGAELQLDWAPIDGLSVTAGGTYVNSKIQGNFINVTALAETRLLSGEPFPLTPKWQANFDVAYETPLNGSVSGFIGVNGAYQGATNSGLGQHDLLRIDDFFLVDGRVGIKFSDEWQISLFGRNLTDKYYWNFTNYQGPNAYFRYAGMPRTWGVKFDWEY